MSKKETSVPEWVRNPDNTTLGVTSNPITGCLNRTAEGLCKSGLFPCYAWKLANTRLKHVYLNSLGKATLAGGNLDEAIKDPFYPRFWPEKLEKLPKNKGIFADDMSDMFGKSVPDEWIRRQLNAFAAVPSSRFYLLTKQPQRLPEFSPFPDNCWVGVTAVNATAAEDAGYYLDRIQAKVKYLSLEPLLSRQRLYFNSNLSWLIIGACTGSRKEMEALVARYPELTVMPWRNKYTAQPRIEWVKEIVEAADAAGIPVFLKDNLAPLLPKTYPPGVGGNKTTPFYKAIPLPHIEGR